MLWISEFPSVPPELRLCAQANGLEAQAVEDVEQALEHVQAEAAKVLFLDCPIRNWTPEEVLVELRKMNAQIPVIVRNPQLTVSDAVRLGRLGAQQCFGQEIDLDRLAETLHIAHEAGRRRERLMAAEEAAPAPWRRLLVGESSAIRKVAHIIRLVGNRRCTVLITGETGTGKEMAARALHMASPRSHLPMVTVNCSALPENLLEAELFGHVKGAFTGATGPRIGRCEQAHKSTLFLDEIGDMPLDLQVKLLRVLQEREFQRLGSSETVKVDLRVIAATNVNLLEKVRQGKFRQDLYYRLNVVPIPMPLLRERSTDVPLLVGHFIEKLCRMENIPLKSIEPEALDALCSCDWPGNVRELENSVEMAIALSGDRSTLCVSDFPIVPVANRKVVSIANAPSALPDEGIDFDTAVGQFERALVTQALQRTGGNKTLAADMLGLKRTTLLAKIRNLEMQELSLRTA